MKLRLSMYISIFGLNKFASIQFQLNCHSCLLQEHLSRINVSLQNSKEGFNTLNLKVKSSLPNSLEIFLAVSRQVTMSVLKL